MMKGIHMLIGVVVMSCNEEGLYIVGEQWILMCAMDLIWHCLRTISKATQEACPQLRASAKISMMPILWLTMTVNDVMTHTPNVGSFVCDHIST